MGKIISFRRPHRHRMRQPRWFGATVPIGLIAILLVVIGIVSYSKYFTVSENHSAFLGNPTGEPLLASTKPIIGQASVIDGDTIEIHGRRIRLFGIDAPESGQTCLEDGIPTRCGQYAAFALSDKIGNRPVTCEPKDVDRYNRVVAVCRAADEDLNAWMVSQGMAVAYRRYSTDYVPQEEGAAASKRGIWKGEFIFPWDWRQQNENHNFRTLPRSFKTVPTGSSTLQTSKTASGSCVIKGNISASGERIYHVPGGKFYNQTIISVSKGERWFCSEAEARAAGWRRSRR